MLLDNDNVLKDKDGKKIEVEIEDYKYINVKQFSDDFDKDRKERNFILPSIDEFFHELASFFIGMLWTVPIEKREFAKLQYFLLLDMMKKGINQHINDIK